MAVIALLQRPGFVERQLRDADHVVGDQQVDLREEVALAWVERVVEVEDPIGDVGQRTDGRGEFGQFNHGRDHTGSAPVSHPCEQRRAAVPESLNQSLD
jgi:hypothetical protein